MVDSVGEPVGAVLVLSGEWVDGSGGVDAKFVRLEVELGTRGCPFPPLIFRNLVLKAGGDDWKFGVDFASAGAASTGGVTSRRGSGRLLVGLVSGMASPADIPSMPGPRASWPADLVDDRGSSGTMLGVRSTVAAISSSTSDWVDSSSSARTCPTDCG